MNKVKIDEALRSLAFLPNAVELVATARLEYLAFIKTKAERTIPVATAKPHLKRISTGSWYLTDDTHFSTWADTPKEAYDEWNIRRHIYTRIPRAGRWNIKDTKRWASGGFKPGCSWIGNKKIAGYDFATDELILRG